VPSEHHSRANVIALDPAAERAWSHLRAMANGDHDGLVGLYEMYGARVYSLALRMLRDSRDAEEVAQDVFAQARRTAAGYDRGRGTVGAWLLVMARTRSLDRLRARRVTGRSPSGDEIEPERIHDTAPLPDLVAISEQEAAALRRALDDLPGDQRSAIELAYFEGLTHPEVAVRLAQPLGTVKTRIRLGLMKLREVFARSSRQDGTA
jgi:RNA polymerase sigma-70 factor (ECF subfamily)